MDEKIVMKVTIYFRPSVLKALDSTEDSREVLHDISIMETSDGFLKLVSEKYESAHLYPVEVIKSVEAVRE